MQLVRGAVVLEAADDRLVGEDGVPEPAQITLRAPSAAVLSEPAALAMVTACFSALATVSFGVREDTLMVAFVALETPSVAPDFDSWTTRSPPRTGRPS